MAGEQLEEVEVAWDGLAGDRRFAFVRPGLERSGFPWLTIRQRPEMVRYRPRFLDPDRADASRAVVHTPDGADLDVIDPRLAAELGEGVRVMKQERGVFDAAPLSIVTTQTVAELGALLATSLDTGRFRPSLLIEASTPTPFAEEAWVGSVLRIGGMRMRVERRDPRCVIVDVDPATAERDPRVLRTIAQERSSCLGVYGSTVEPGRVTMGDRVLVEEP